MFEETHVETNVCWWVVLVLWLKRHPKALPWYRIIQKAHPHSVPTIQTLWDHCWKVWHLERQKKKTTSHAEQWLSRYHDPRAKGSLGGVQRFARAHNIPLKRSQRVLERNLAYTLHKPRRRRFTTLPVIVGGLDDQWVADLVEVQPLAKYNRGIRYLLMVLDVLSNYVWVQPLKAKTEVALVKALDKILKQGHKSNRLQTDRGTEFYNRTF